MGKTSEFRTIARPSEGIIREKMSKFIALAFPVTSAEEARAAIKGVENEYHDARHVCWAYMLGAAMEEFQWNDNGEPSGTAGKPILGQIRSAGLTNVAVAVVRYFGGIKLGTSGLIAAYREAARTALENAVTVTDHETADVSFTFPYMEMNAVMRAAKDPEVRIVNQEFDNTCRMTLRIRADRADTLRGRLADIPGVSLDD